LSPESQPPHSSTAVQQLQQQLQRSTSFTYTPPITKEDRPYPNGLFKMLDFITSQEEEHLLNSIYDEEWSNDLPRRTQQFGYKFCHHTNAILNANPIPQYYAPFIARLQTVRRDDGKFVFPNPPNQLIVNEYTPGQGIHPHTDRNTFEDGIVVISLLSDVQMIFDSSMSGGGGSNSRDHNNTRNAYSDVQVPSNSAPPQLTSTQTGIWLDRRSLVVMCGDSRYRWTHQIPHRKMDVHEGRMIKRKNRVSVTFRRVKEEFTPSSSQTMSSSEGEYSSALPVRSPTTHPFK
jgi:alkylated DNA repair dioxygenase AlkB